MSIMSITTLLAMTSIPAQAAGEDLIYVAVEPCRLVDTRKTSVMFNGVPRNFQVSGANLSGQGGDPAGCPNPKPGVEPLAVSAYIVAVPTASSVGGWLTAFPSDQTPPTSNSVATVNYAKGQVIGNTTNATLCPDPALCQGGPLGLVSFSSQQQIVVDVQGYFYPSGGAGSCPADMVTVGSLCVDKYEASVTNAAGDVQYGIGGVDDYPCKDSGSNCGATIFARSVNGPPSSAITWYQAGVACANAGKRLPTSSEWQAAAAGTPSGDFGVGVCNANSGAVVDTGSIQACVSSTGAFDMIGNVWEWVADMDNPSGTGYTDTLSSQAWSMGDSWKGLGNATTRALWVESTPNVSSSRRGFRCVR